MTIAVTGATGGVGSRVLRHVDARPITRRDADYDDPAALRRAFRGVTTLVFISSDGDGEVMRRHHENVVAAAADAGVEHVVYTSVIDIAPDSPFYYAAIHRDTEAALSSIGVARCFARTSIFAEFFDTTWVEPARAGGTLAVPAGDGRMSLITRDEVARALAAAAATRCEGVRELTGPEAVTAAEVAERAGLRYDPPSEAAYRRRLAEEHTPAWLIEAFSSMFASVRQGRFALVSPDAGRLTRRRSRS